MIYSFGDWELDVELYELRRGHQPIRLEPQVFNVLAYLVQHHDRIISKPELLTHLWPDQYIGDSALERCIMSARKAIGDSGCKQRIIKTFNRRGYRVIAPVTEVAPNSGISVQTPAVMAPELNRGEPAQNGADRPTQRALSQPSLPQSAVPGLEPRRQCVTVLSCAFVTAQALVKTDAIEDVQAVLKSLHDQMVLPVQAHGGLVVQFQDGCFLALFGLTSPADHAWQAVQAALELRRRRFDHPQGLEAVSQGLPLCIGLHTGEVIEKRLGDESPVIYMAVDDTMQFAANLCSCAEPGRILVSEVTYQLIQEASGGEIVARLAGVKADPTPMAAYDISQRMSPVEV